MNTFPFILRYSPKMLGLLILFAILVVFSDRMSRCHTRTTSNTNVPGS